MSSDEAYASFLDKANEDPSSNTKTASSSSAPKSGGSGSGGGSLSTKAVDTDVPKGLQDVAGQEFYVSDSDEPWEAVSLNWEGKGDLDEGESKVNSIPNSPVR